MKTEIVMPSDDPVGDWHRCPHCTKNFFVSVGEAKAGQVKYCPCCAEPVELAPRDT